jgi:hypothetical protein
MASIGRQVAEVPFASAHATMDAGEDTNEVAFEAGGVMEVKLLQRFS